MPHVIVKLWPGKSEREKVELTDKIVQAVTTALGYGEESVSVALQEVTPAAWKKEVYGPEIEAKPQLLYKKPGYRMETSPEEKKRHAGPKA